MRILTGIQNRKQFALVMHFEQLRLEMRCGFEGRARLDRLAPTTKGASPAVLACVHTHHSNWRLVSSCDSHAQAAPLQ